MLNFPIFNFLKRAEIDPSDMLKRTLGDYALPSFPAVIIKVLKMVRDPFENSTTIAEHISQDPGLSVKILSTVNSAAYSPREKVSNLSQAVAMLGIAALESLVLSIGVKESLKPPRAHGFNPEEFWLMSARRASTAVALAEIIKPSTKSESFMVGMLQDLAIPMLASNFKDYEDVLEKHRTSAEPLDDLERTEFGWDHAQVGACICNEWGLPESLGEAIEQHHKGGAACPEAAHLVSYIRLTGDNSGVDEMIDVIIDKHDIDEQKVIETVEKGFDNAEELIRLMK